MIQSLPRRASLLLLMTLAACSTADRDLQAPRDTGPSPTLVEPQSRLIPTVNIAPAVGWPDQAMPLPAEGFSITAFARGMDHPRTVLVLPNGDVLVAESNAPPRPDDGQGIKGMVMKAVMKKAGAGVPSANRITLLRDADGDGVAETRSVFLSGLNSPFGMALVGDTLFVANTDAVVRFPYREGDTEITVAPVKVADLPAGPINHHWTKAMIASADGSALYVGVGSNSNVGENGMENEVDRAAILQIDAATGNTRLFASGLRNPTGLAFHPQDDRLWAVVNERDELGDHLVPDYLTAITDGAFYGFPYSYFGQHVDTRVEPPMPAMVATAVTPDYALGSHVAPLGLAFYEAERFAPRFRHGAFIGLHGSWNRTPLSGYKVVFVPFNEGKPAGPIETVLDGFVNADGDAQGRPVGVAVANDGALLVADDVGNAVWRLDALRPTK